MPTIITGETGVNQITDGVITANDLASGSVTSAKLATGAATANLSAGAVLQVVSATTTTTTTTTSTSYVDTNLSASITPSSSSNKILVLVTGNIQVNDLGNNYGDAFVNITRGSTEITATRIAVNFGSTTWTDYITSAPLTYLDSPSTTSSVTYKVRIATSNSQIIHVGGGGSSAGTITLMEIKG
jgi:hypothetical protein